MPFLSEVDVIVLLVCLFTRVTVASEITAPDGSLTVPRSEPRYCACRAGVRIAQQNAINQPSNRSFEPFMTFSSGVHRFGRLGVPQQLGRFKWVEKRTSPPTSGRRVRSTLS